jgi:hypothetical protein
LSAYRSFAASRAHPTRWTAAVALVVASLVLAACEGGSADTDANTATPPTPTGARPASTATLSILSPANGAVIRGSTVDVRLRLQHARIVRPTSNDLRPDEGHIHILLDGSLVSMNYGLTDEIDDVPRGRHLLQAEFVASDHAPFDPRVVVVSSFEVHP